MKILRENSARLRALTDELEEIIMLREPQADRLVRVRSRVAGLVREQFDRESRALEGLKTGDPRHADDRLVDDYHRSFRMVYLSYSQIVGQWPLSHVLADWRGYRATCRSQIDRYREYLDWVEAAIYPRLERLARGPLPPGGWPPGFAPSAARR
jgi:hypothetical protein